MSAEKKQGSSHSGAPTTQNQPAGPRIHPNRWAQDPCQSPRPLNRLVNIFSAPYELSKEVGHLQVHGEIISKQTEDLFDPPKGGEWHLALADAVAKTN